METVGDIPQRRGKNADPEFQRQRALKMVAARTSLDNYIRHIVDRASELTDEQRQRLNAVLSGGAR